VFADAHALSGDGAKKVELVGDNEDSAVLRGFLALITAGKVTLGPDISTAATLGQLASLLKKWDCAVPLAFLLQQVKFSIMTNKTAPLLGFCFCSHFHDDETLDIVLRAPDRTWTDEPLAIRGRSMLDPTGWPPAVWFNIKNPHYLFGITRAYYHNKGSTALHPGTFRHYLTLSMQSA
jgi:hypothetical protein